MGARIWGLGFRVADFGVSAQAHVYRNRFFQIQHQHLIDHTPKSETPSLNVSADIEYKSDDGSPVSKTTLLQVLFKTQKSVYTSILGDM